MISPISGNSTPPGAAQSANRAGGTGARFAGKFAAASPEGEYGLLRALGTIWRNFRQTENLRVMNALLMREGVPRAFELGVLFPPVGWVVSILGAMGPRQLAARKGAKMLEKIQQGYPDGMIPGPLAHFNDLQDMYKNPTRYHRVDPEKQVTVWQKWISKFNGMLEQTFKEEGMDPKQAEKVEKAVRRLQLHEDRPMGKLLERGLLVKMNYGERAMGRAARFLSNPPKWAFIMRMPVLKWPFMAVGAALHGVLMLGIKKDLKAGKLSKMI